MAYETILVDVEDRVATITLNRPDRMNAWSAQMSAELSCALLTANDDDNVRAIVITGAGRAFCAGADLATGSGTFAGREGREAPPRQTYPWEIDKPVIAAINGHAIGVGITYPLMCDIRYVAEDAKIQFAFVRRGVIPELASHTLLPRVIGFSKAADLLLSGRLILGKEAAELGLATAALPAEAVLPAAQEKAREIAVNAAPVSVALAKRLLWDGMTLSVPEMRRRENRAFTWAGNQADAREGVLSFLEKRQPDWKLSMPRHRPVDLLPAQR
jgi:enoyl-CoA hydratase/carnithine racemase